MDMVEIAVWACLGGSVVVLGFVIFKVIKLMNSTHSED